MNFTTHRGITMQWTLARGHFHNAANPFTITGWINGECRMEHATSARNIEQAEKQVIARIEEVAAEAAITKAKGGH